MYSVTGSNLFGQWFSDDMVFKSIMVVQDRCNTLNIDQSKLIHMTWSYNIFQVGEQFYVSGTWRGKERQLIHVNFPKASAEFPIIDSKFLVVGNDHSLVAVNIKERVMWIMNLSDENDIKRINMNTETPLPSLEKKIKKLKKEDDAILKVITTNNLCLCLTTEGVVYSGFLPSHLDTSHCVGKVTDIQCGFEHSILLTDAGRVYTWGNGRRLQLGHGDLKNLDSPLQVEALAGIKIIKVIAGGWHSLALSEFGDLYAWGWNDTGQLGVKEEVEQLKNSHGVLKKEGLRSYPQPTLVDIFDDNGEQVELNIVDIACGSRHSAILLDDNTLWTTGYNKYGQLGFPPELYPTVDFFKKCFECSSSSVLKCGPWCTVLVNKTK